MKRRLMKLCKAEEAIMRLRRRIPLRNAEHEKKRCDVVLTSTSKLWAHSFQFATPQAPPFHKKNALVRIIWYAHPQVLRATCLLSGKGVGTTSETSLPE